MDTVYAPLVVVAGTASNLLFAAMFVARVVAPRRARLLGLVGTGMAVPLATATVVAAADPEADAWMAILPAVFVGFAVVEVLVDVVLDVDVRSTRWLWPYLLAFYLAQWAVVGAAFLATTAGGVVVLITYFACLAATAWSYRRVGHGDRRPSRTSRRAGASPRPAGPAGDGAQPHPRGGGRMGRTADAPRGPAS